MGSFVISLIENILFQKTFQDIMKCFILLFVMSAYFCLFISGAACEYCSPGFYGNATVGTEVDCLPCPCYSPRVINATCEKDSNSTDIICPFCETGYVGIHCDEWVNCFYSLSLLAWANLLHTSEISSIYTCFSGICKL